MVLTLIRILHGISIPESTDINYTMLMINLIEVEILQYHIGTQNLFLKNRRRWGSEIFQSQLLDGLCKVSLLFLYLGEIF